MMNSRHYKFLLSASVALGVLLASPMKSHADEIPEIILDPLGESSYEEDLPPSPLPVAQPVVEPTPVAQPLPEPEPIEIGEPINLYDSGSDVEEGLEPVTAAASPQADIVADSAAESGRPKTAVALPDPQLEPDKRPEPRATMAAGTGAASSEVTQYNRNTAPQIVEDPADNLLPELQEEPAPAPVPVEQPVAVVSGDVLTPNPDELVDLDAAINEQAQQQVQEQPFYAGQLPVEEINQPTRQEPDVFYDSDSIAPAGEMAKRGAITKVDPVTQPASRFVVVRQGAKADTMEAQLVAASRAMKLGRYDSALEMYERLYDENRRDPRILMGRAVALQHLDRFDEAMNVYEEFSEINPNNVEARVNMLGLLATRFPAVATQRLKSLHEEHPDHIGVLAQLAIAAGKQGDYESAMRYLGIAASMQPKNANHIYNMAVVADRAGDRKRAVRFYEEALELDTTFGQGQTIPRQNIYERLAAIR